jgi:hypothetical protein
MDKGDGPYLHHPSSTPLPPMRRPGPAPNSRPGQTIQRAAAMQGTTQILRSTRKRVEEVKRMREAIERADSILTEQEVKQVTQQAALLG